VLVRREGLLCAHCAHDGPGMTSSIAHAVLLLIRYCDRSGAVAHPQTCEKERF